MKAFVNYPAPVLRPTRAALWLLLLTLALTSLHQPGFAQKKEHPILRTSQAETDSTRGYWELRTLVDTRMTVIQFFDPNRQLLYQESLPEKWVKPTPHNRRQFDRLLHELMAQRLVTRRIKTERLPTLLPEVRLPLVKLGADRKQNAPGEEMPYTISAFVNQAGVLRLLVDSPLRERYKIELTDERGNLHYQEFNNLAHYRRRLDVSALGSGSYSLLVRIAGHDVRYELKNGSITRLYQLDSLAVNQR
ncbi:hypothetical protein [Persicitalea sp.]|uniref:hypothetical protein n=1 Tax=Persicitalea sp. TaxID=3100273 RepID=UPI0035942F59